MPEKFRHVIDFIKSYYDTNDFLMLHRPVFNGKEREYLIDTIDSNFVSSVGEYVNQFEQMVADYTGTKYAIAMVNGTSALHIALLAVGVESDTEVITQPFTFVATCNAIKYIKAEPLFVDINEKTLGLCPEKLESFLQENCDVVNDICINKLSKKRISACLPMHTFGHSVKIDKIVEVCKRYNIPVVEDSAEALGSYYKDKHTGSFGDIGIFSFNGNKIITTGGGGMIVTNNENMAKWCKHVTTTAKKPHKWEYVHDQIGYNYRLPNVNAALGCAQMNQLDFFILEKRDLAEKYKEFFKSISLEFLTEPEFCKSNYWLNAVILNDRKERNEFLQYTNDNNVMTRPAWELMNNLDMFKLNNHSDLTNAIYYSERLVNIPSSVRS